MRILFDNLIMSNYNWYISRDRYSIRKEESVNMKENLKLEKEKELLGRILLL